MSSDARFTAWALGLYLRFIAWIRRVEREGKEESS
jgi:hypothetical protein